MKNLAETFKYIYKNFLFVIFSVIIPAIYIGVFINPFKMFSFNPAYYEAVINNAGDVFNLMFDFSWQNIILNILGGILVVIFMSAYLGNIENHFRSGKIKLDQTNSVINNNILACILYYLLLFTIILLFKFIVMFVTFTLHVLFSGLGSNVKIYNFIITTLVNFGLLFLFAYILSFIFLAIPTTLFYGYSIRNSLSYSGEMMSKRSHTTMAGIIIPVTFILILSLLGSLFNFLVAAQLINILFAFIYFPVYAYTIFFKYSGNERFDNTKSFFS